MKQLKSAASRLRKMKTRRKKIHHSKKIKK